MAKKFLVPIDLTKLEIRNAVHHLLTSDPGSPVEGLFYHNTTDHTFNFYNGSAFIKLGTLDQISKAVASLDLNSQKIINLATGTSANDAVNLAQMQAAIAGVNWKSAVRAATTANGTLATAFANGQTIDGVALVTGDRILLKDQTSGADDGIYTVNASGAPTRATDADAASELLQAAVFVEEGTTNADTGWVNSTNAPITVGTTALVFVKFTGSALTAGTGITVSGSTWNVTAATAVGTGGPGGGLVANAHDLAIDKSIVPTKYSADVGDGSTTAISVTHGIGTVDVQVVVKDKTTPFEEVVVDWDATDTTHVTLNFAVAPSSNQYRVTVIG